MKFLYSYKTSDNEPRDGEIFARSRDDVYSQLKLQGIRPFKVQLAPGVWNRVLSLGWPAIVVPALALVAVIASFGYFRERSETPIVEDTVFLSSTRRQIVGDMAIIEASILNGWSDVFAEEGERFLASFAIPGVPAGVRTTNVSEIEKSLSRKISVKQDDTMEAKQIKSMVEGMKDELRGYLKSGGTIQQYGERLVERQEQEQAYYRRIKEEVDAAVREGHPEKEVLKIWKTGNAELRNMGIKLVPLPDFQAD